MTTVVKIGNKYEESGFCPYCQYDDEHKKPCIECGEKHTPTPESFSRWLHRNFTNRGTKAHENEVKMYTTHARGGEHKKQIHNLRSSLESGKPKKLRDWGKGRPKKAIINKLYDEKGCIYCRTNEVFKKRKIPTEKMIEAFRNAHHDALNTNPEFQKMSKEQKNEQLAAVEHDVKVYEIHGRKPDDVHAMIDHVKRERKIDDANKAVMAVSSPDDGETCNCQHGDHSNANGQQAGMYNQDLGRANWQGQGLPQPKQDKDSCQCDEKPAEADKVPNADARISDKDMKENKKKFLNYSDEEIVEVDGKTTKRKKKKIKKEMTPAQLEARKKKKPYRHSDLRRRKYRDKKRTSATRGKNRMGIVYISDLEEGGDGILREGNLGRNAALSHGQKVGHKRRREAKERKVREGMEALDKKIKALANIIKRNKKYKPELFIGDLDEEGKVTDATRQANIHAAKRRKRKLPPRTVNEHEGRVTRGKIRHGVEALDKKLKALEDIIKKKKKGRKRGAGKKWMKGLTFTKPSAPKPEVEAGQAGGDVVTAPVKRKKPIVEEGREKIETADDKAAKRNRKIAELTNPRNYARRKKIPPKPALNTKTPAERKETLTAQNRDATGRNIPQKPKKKKKKKDEATKANDSFPVFGDDKKKKKKKRTGESAGEKEKRELMANLSPAVLANMKRIEALNQKKVEEKDQRQVTAGKGRGKQMHDKLREDIANIPVKKVPKKKKPKPKKSKFDFFNRAHGQKFDWDAFWKKHGLKKPEKKEKADKDPEGYDLPPLGETCDSPNCSGKPTTTARTGKLDRKTGKKTFTGYMSLCDNCTEKLQEQLRKNPNVAEVPRYTDEELKAEDTPYYDLLSDKPKRKKKPTKVLYRDLFEKSKKGKKNLPVVAKPPPPIIGGAAKKPSSSSCPNCKFNEAMEQKGKKGTALNFMNVLNQSKISGKKRNAWEGKISNDDLAQALRGYITHERDPDKYHKMTEPKSKPKPKPKKIKVTEKAEENQFGAWGQRGLGDGNGTGAIQGAGDTHLISPVKAEKLNELMRGLRYMPRSVSRKRKK